MNIQFSLNLLGNYTMDVSSLSKEQNKEPSLPQDQIEQQLLTEDLGEQQPLHEDQGQQQHLPEDLDEQQPLHEDLGEQQLLPEDQNVRLFLEKGIDGATLVIIIIHKSQLDNPIIPYRFRGG